MKLRDRVLVVGPPGSAQLGKTGVVEEVGESAAVVKLDGESRPRNFAPKDLAPEGNRNTEVTGTGAVMLPNLFAVSQSTPSEK